MAKERSSGPMKRRARATAGADCHFGKYPPALCLHPSPEGHSRSDRFGGHRFADRISQMGGGFLG